MEIKHSTSYPGFPLPPPPQQAPILFKAMLLTLNALFDFAAAPLDFLLPGPVSPSGTIRGPPPARSVRPPSRLGGGAFLPRRTAAHHWCNSNGESAYRPAPSGHLPRGFCLLPLDVPPQGCPSFDKPGSFHRRPQAHPHPSPAFPP